MKSKYLGKQRELFWLNLKIRKGGNFCELLKGVQKKFVCIGKVTNR